MAMRREVDAQGAAKQISEALATSMRWSLRASAFSSVNINARDIITTLRIPPDNAKLAAAATALEETFTNNQKERSALLVAGAEEIRRRYKEAVAGATNADAVLAVRGAIEGARLAQEPSDARSSDYASAIRESSAVLEALEDVLRVIELGKLDRLAEAVARYRTELNSAWAGMRELNGPAQARLEHWAVPFKEAVTAAETELVAAFSTGRAVSELEAGLNRLSEAEKRAWVVNNGSFQGASRTAPYRAALTAVTMVATGDAARFRAALEQAKEATQSTQDPQLEKLRAVLETLEREAGEMIAKTRETKSAQFRTRLAAATRPDDLEALAGDLRSAFSRQEGDAENWSALAGELMKLAARWAGGDSAGDENRGSYTGRLAAELNAVRERIDRDTIARRLRFPELKAEPLLSTPLSEAVESLCDQLAQKKEWRRLFDLLTLGPVMQPQRPMSGGRDDTVTALRAFFVGQNLELAEQWLQAASAYQLVLQSASTRAPIREAAERLKEITRKHPEAAAKPGGVDAQIRRKFCSCGPFK